MGPIPTLNLELATDPRLNPVRRPRPVAVMHFVQHCCQMRLDVRRTTPFTAEDYAAVQSFVAAGTPEHEALARVSPVPLRDGSEGSTLRALTLLGMAYVREREAEESDLAAGYDELATERAAGPEDATGMRRRMARHRAGSEGT